MNTLTFCTVLYQEARYPEMVHEYTYLLYSTISGSQISCDGT